jgi:hypothetical protein
MMNWRCLWMKNSEHLTISISAFTNKCINRSIRVFESLLCLQHKEVIMKNRVPINAH